MSSDPALPSRIRLTRRGFLLSATSATTGSLTAAETKTARTDQIAPTPSIHSVPPRPVSLHINGSVHDLMLEPRVTLLDALREHAELMGTKKGCDRGQCGACTVLVDGHRINACLTLAVMQEGRRITTIEGLGEPERLHPMQHVFLDHDAFQCGYCTPGQICSAIALLEEAKAGEASAISENIKAPVKLTEDEIRERMSGNLCRCGAYVNIVKAIQAAADLPAQTVDHQS